MTIDYQTSSGHSFIAGKMSDTAMTKMKQSVAEKVTNLYNSFIFQKWDRLKLVWGQRQMEVLN